LAEEVLDPDVTKEAADSENDLHSLPLFSTFPEALPRLAGQRLPKPFLTLPTILSPL
jgi:hypothetical protein